MKFHYVHTDKVRDYECDIQGIVNNANYQHYMEHTRHEFLQHYGLSFSDLHNKGCDVVVARANIAYKSPLRPAEEYKCGVYVEKVGLRYVFTHHIYRCSDDVLCLKATMEIVCLVDGHLVDSYPDIEEFLAKLKAEEM